MKRIALHALGVVTLVLAPEPAEAQTFWINEFHYDNTGPDSGEFVEVAAPASFTDLASITLTLYNGGDGLPYGTHSLSTFTQGATQGGITLYSKAVPNLQNGAPDGLVLSQPGTVHQFISYEGTFTGASGPAAGVTSVDIGIAQPATGAPIGSSLGLTGMGVKYSDFAWQTLNTATPGQFNTGQSAVPEPGAWALSAGAALGAFALVRRRLARARTGPEHPAPATAKAGRRP